jgi:hypothetical protein
MSLQVSGGIELNGLMRVNVRVPSIACYHTVVLKGTSSPLKGSIIVTDCIKGVGFGVSSTHPQDVGMTVYFDVVETAGACERWNATHSSQTLVEASPASST